MTFEPMGARVLLEPKKSETKTASGIVISLDDKKIEQIGKVISVGQGHILADGTRIPVSVHPGDTVMFAKYAGTAVTHEGKNYLLLEEADILGRICED